MSLPSIGMRILKRAVVQILGRQNANRLTAPFYDWRANRRTQKNLAMLPGHDLRVNLGCGPRPLPGWVNVDYRRGPQVDVVWDMRDALPFGDNTCSAVFSEHAIEHLERREGEFLLAQCYRILQPGGVLRLSTPDAGLYLRSYAGDGEFLRHPAFSEPIDTPLDRVNMMMREHGQHLWVYDAPSLFSLLRRAGFSSAVEQRFGESLHPEMKNIDAEDRAFESLYVEGVK